MTEYLYLIGTAFFVISNASTIIKFVKSVKDNALVYKEIYRAASWRTIADFCTFKTRLVLSRHFETGFLSGTPQNHSLVYYDGSTKYIIRFPKKRGPCTFSQVTCSSDDLVADVTEDIRRFAGPSHNFHGIPTTPKMLGFDNLTFVYRNGQTVKYEEGDVISLTLPKTETPVPE